jgi:glutamine---fructose-6-phosphate transaminase (isomerizing)
MCGIIALLGIECSRILLEGLRQLQNRGYDSAGIITLYQNKFLIKKYASNNDQTAISNLEKELYFWKKSINGIAHTRWATHGPKTDINSHPHLSYDGKFAIVHNGIIENYLVIKKRLQQQGIKFVSQTDTEIIVNLIAYQYQQLSKNKKNLKKNLITEAIRESLSQLEGTWGLTILSLDHPNKLFCTRRGSPLLVSKNNKFAIVTSEQSGFCNKVSNYIILENNDICILTQNNDTITIDTKKTYQTKLLKLEYYKLTPDPYQHWTLKEIMEQTDSSLRAISLGGRMLSTNTVKLGGLNEYIQELLSIDNLILLGCGTSFYAGLIGMNFFKELCDFNIVQIFDGAEFTEYDIPKIGKTACILLSQSGETKDLHRCIQIGRDKDLLLIGVVNVPDSMIAREVDCGCYLNAGREVGVASTKSFTSQVILLSMISIWFSQHKKINSGLRKKYITNLRKLHQDIDDTIKICNKIIPKYVNIFKNKQHCFLLGKGKAEAIAKEGALKIKEISYIHAEGYSASSLKHGPFALLEKDFPVIMIAPQNNYYSKLENAYEEVLSRYAKIIFITDNQECIKENTIILPQNKSYSELLSIIPIQFLAYYISIEKGINPDMPKNLAKVVTVE